MATNSFSTLTSLDGLGGVIKVKVLEFQSSHLNGILGINGKERDSGLLLVIVPEFFWKNARALSLL